MLMGLLGSIAGSVIGGLFDRSEQKRSLKASQGQFNQQMDHSIRRRVEDAKRAGIHPLYAIGASAGASPTIMAGQSSSGSAIGDAVRNIGSAYDNYQLNKKAEAEAARQGSIQERQMHLEALRTQAQINRDNAAARLDNAQALRALSRNAMATQAFNHLRPTPSFQEETARKTVEANTNPTYLSAYGEKIPMLSGWSPYQAIEDEFGEPVAWPYGVLKFLNETGHQLGNFFADRHLKYGGTPEGDYRLAP